MSQDFTSEYDAILVLGGGVEENGDVKPWVVPRLNEALQTPSRYIITLSAGTTHKAPPLDDDGFPVFESVAGAKYLLNGGAKPERLLTECCSYDTIGNAFFARVIHTDVLGLKKLLVITSEFHMDRTRQIFEWVFGLAPHSVGYELEFRSVPNVGMNAESLQARINKERQQLVNLRALTDRFPDIGHLHRWLFTEHGAYAAGRRSLPKAASNTLLNSY